MNLLERIKTKSQKILDSLPLKTILFLSTFLLVRLCFAEDALAEAEPIVKDTYNGSLKTYLYVGEAVAAIMALIFTRNIKHLGGVLGVAFFINLVAKLAGF